MDFGGSTLIELNASPWNMRSSVFVSRAVIVSLSFIRRTISIRLVPLTVGSPKRAASWVTVGSLRWFGVKPGEGSIRSRKAAR